MRRCLRQLEYLHLQCRVTLLSSFTMPYFYLQCRVTLQIALNEFSCKFQKALQMRQKVIITLWWEARLSSASRNHLTTFCRSFAYYACLRLCSAVVHFIRNETIVCNLSAMADQRKPRRKFSLANMNMTSN